MLAHTLAAQARKPSGLLGRLFGMGMGRINQGVNDWVISLLELQPSDHVLEIGFGPGKALRKVLNLVPDGRVAGLDMSATMMKQATRLNRLAIQHGKADLQLGEAARMPFANASFNRIFCVNVVYFWQNPDLEFQQMHRVCRPGGMVAVYIGDRQQMAGIPMTRTGIFKLYGADDIKRLLQKAGFSDVNIHEASIAQGPISKGACITARRMSMA